MVHVLSLVGLNLEDNALVVLITILYIVCVLLSLTLLFRVYSFEVFIAFLSICNEGISIAIEIVIQVRI